MSADSPMSGIRQPSHPGPSTINVAPATEADLAAIAKVFLAVLRDLPYYNSRAKDREASKYKLDHLREKIADEPTSVLSAKDMEGALVGFCFNHFDDYLLWIDWFGVPSHARHRGVGRALLRGAEEVARARGCHKVWCDSRTENRPSIALLQSHGFQKIVEIPNHWYGQDFLLWQKFI